MSARRKRLAADLSIIDLRRPDSAPLVLIEKLQLIERLIDADPEARLVVLTTREEVAAAIEQGGARLQRYLAAPGYAEQLGLGVSPRDRGHGVGATLREIEWRHIQRVLALNKGNKAATARALQIHLATLNRKLARPPRVT